MGAATPIRASASLEWTIQWPFELPLMAKNAIFSHDKTQAGGRAMNMNVSLPDELANFVKDKVSTGRYGSSSEVVREALRLMEKTELQEAEKLALLRQAWTQGVDSGDAGEIDFIALKKDARARRAAANRGA
ncbi:type II toxin-antitoxin system ParD family antitoxin [Rhodoblastus sphagnicola]